MTTAADPRFVLELPPLPEALRHASVDELYKQGFVAEGAEQFELAAACFEEVRRRQPNNPYVLLDLARVYFRLFEFDRAKSLLGEATKHAGRDPDFWYQVGIVYQNARLDRDAERCLLLARIHGAGNIAVSAALIAYYESRGQMKQAKAALERVVRRGASSGRITALKGVLLLRSGDRPAAIAALTASLSELPEQTTYQIDARYVLARALAETGQEAASLEYLRQAKVRQAGQPEVQRQMQASNLVHRFRGQIRAAIESVDIRADWRAEAGPGQRPLVFLLGYPRSGTTLLEQVVESHSAIHSFEETGAFTRSTYKLFGRPLLAEEKPWDVINKADSAGLQRAREWYLEYLRRLGAPPEPSTMLMDKNPGLTGHIQTIARLFPEAKFLVMLRDPRDSCLSAYQTQVILTPFSVNWLHWSDTVKHCVHILEHWVALRDRLPNPYLEVRYEDLITDLPGTGRRVMEFLGLNWEPQQENFAQHARAKQVYSPTLYEVRQGLTQQARGKWRRFGLDYSAGEPGLTSLLERYGYEVERRKDGEPAALEPIAPESASRATPEEKM